MYVDPCVIEINDLHNYYKLLSMVKTSNIIKELGQDIFGGDTTKIKIVNKLIIYPSTC
jgi:hypothetical protein